jgi:hypothetical protein
MALKKKLYGSKRKQIMGTLLRGTGRTSTKECRPPTEARVRISQVAMPGCPRTASGEGSRQTLFPSFMRQFYPHWPAAQCRTTRVIYSSHGLSRSRVWNRSARRTAPTSRRRRSKHGRRKATPRPRGCWRSSGTDLERAWNHPTAIPDTRKRSHPCRPIGVERQPLKGPVRGRVEHHRPSISAARRFTECWKPDDPERARWTTLGGGRWSEQ